MKKLTTYFAGAAVAAISMATMACLAVTASAADENTATKMTVGSNKYDTFADLFEAEKGKSIEITLNEDVTPTKADWAWGDGVAVTFKGSKSLDLSNVAMKTSAALTLEGITLKGNGKTAITAGGDVTVKGTTFNGLATIKGDKGTTFTVAAATALPVSIEGFDKVSLSAGEATLTGNSAKSALKVSTLDFAGGKIKAKDAKVVVNNITVTGSSAEIVMDTDYTVGVIVIGNDVDLGSKTLTLKGATTTTPAPILAKKAKNVTSITVDGSKLCLGGQKGLYKVLAQAFTVSDGSSTLNVGQWDDVAAFIADKGGNITVTVTEDTPKDKITMPKGDKYESLTIKGTSGKTFNFLGSLALTAPTTFDENLALASFKKATDTEQGEYSIASKSDITINKLSIDGKVKSVTAKKLTLAGSGVGISAAKIAVDELVVSENATINANSLSVKTSTDLGEKKVTFTFIDAKAYTPITDAKTLLKSKVTIPGYYSEKNWAYGDGSTYVFAAIGKGMALCEKDKAITIYKAAAKSDSAPTIVFKDAKDVPKYLKANSTADDDWCVVLASGAQDYEKSYNEKTLVLPAAGTKYKSFNIAAGEKKVTVDLSKAKLTSEVKFDNTKVIIVAVPAKTDSHKFILNKDGKAFARLEATWAS